MKPSTLDRPGRSLSAGALMALLLCAAVVLSGCSWTGKGKDVAAALQKSSQAKTSTYSGTVAMEIPGGSASDSMTMTFTGSSDMTNPAAPKGEMNMTVGGQQIGIVEPGDGNTYTTSSAGTFGAPTTAATNVDTGKSVGLILTALGSAIGKFREGNPTATDSGTVLKTVIANGNVGKICDDVVPAFGSAMSTASSGSSEFKGLNTGDFSGVCKKLLPTDPTLWFGIDPDGQLRMVALKAVLAMPMVGKATMTVRFDLLTLNQPVTVTKPNGAKMYPTQQAAEQAFLGSLQSSSSTTSTASATGYTGA